MLSDLWLLANPGKDLRDLLVLEARLGQDDRDVTPAPTPGEYPFFDGKLGIPGGKCMIQGEKIPERMRATTTKSAFTKRTMGMRVTMAMRKLREKLGRLIAPLKASLIF